MIIPLRDIRECYDSMLNGSVRSGCSVVIFVANDCDSIASLKIITVSPENSPLVPFSS